MVWRRTLFMVLIVFMCFGFIQCGNDDDDDNNDDNQPSDGTQVGMRAINFTLADQNGNAVSLHDYQGQVILLDLSTMW